MERGAEIEAMAQAMLEQFPPDQYQNLRALRIEGHASVAHHGGASKQRSPMIAADDSFQVKFPPPRSWMFIHHTHAIEEGQQLAGLAGVIVVSDSGVARNQETDKPTRCVAYGTGDPAEGLCTTVRRRVQPCAELAECRTPAAKARMSPVSSE